MKAWPVLAVATLALLVAGCRSPTPPRGVAPLQGFDLARYLGRWYEVARLDNRFERGLTQVSADYSLRSDGAVRVVNRGYDACRGRWRQSEGRADFTGSPTRAALKVSFFGPFYGGYNVIALDAAYRYALVCGPDRDYLWLLSRTPTMPLAVRQAYVDLAARLGFPTARLHWVQPENDTPPAR
ncbi:outer membrane lipoprotein Blc [Edwardsiella tarda]|uniref:outer membrane lipoprotein Blc n=1 Tax=Edwardsiella tarda TaxID=636 RepID=UPI00351C661A